MELTGAPLGFQLQALIQAESSELLANGEIAARNLTTSTVLPRGSFYIVQTEGPGGGTQFLIYTPTGIDAIGRPVVPAGATNALPAPAPGLQPAPLPEP
jgi:hypothetical protein